jgi:hypothetical protein
VNRDIGILQADKGNCRVFVDESKYTEKLNFLLASGVYEVLLKRPKLLQWREKF